jgi:general secretion pathway protein J
MSARASRSAGFTLVELLVALTLFALLSVALFGSLRFGLRATAAGTARLDWSAEIAAASGFLRNEIADAQPLQKTDADGGKVMAFDGDGGSIEFVASPPSPLAEGGWHVLHLFLERGPKGGRLVVTARLVHSDDSDSGDTSVATVARSVLLDGVSAIDIAYFGAYAEGDQPEWHDRWEDEAQLPALVRLRLRFADGREAPALLIAVRAAVPLWHSS